MKTRCIAFIGALLSTFVSYGQARFGIQGSVQSSNLSVSSNGVSVSFDRKIGFRVGVMADLPLGGSALSFRPQALYSAKGFGLPSNLSVGTTNNSLTLSYLEVPLQLMYGLSAGSGKVMLGAGPYVAYLLSQSDGSTTGSTISDSQNRFDLGATLSAGYDTAGGVTLSAYFSPGFTNFVKNSATSGTGTSASSLNTAFGLNIGYFLGSSR